MIEVKVLQDVTFAYDTASYVRSMLWIQEGSVRKEHGGRRERYAGKGWEIYSTINEQQVVFEVSFSASLVYKYITRNENDQWFSVDQEAQYWSFKTEASLNGLSASDIRLIPDVFSKPLPLGDQIVFDRMWPEYVKLLKLKKPSYSERVVTP